jgi:acetate---CoA ligase (ADP-forming)
VNQIQAIFSPKSIAVVGATGRPGSVGWAVFDNIMRDGYTGVVYPVNPKSFAVRGVRAYPNLGSIPDPVDLAVLIVPATTAAAVAEEAAAKGVKGLLVLSAGFKEMGAKGAELEAELARVTLAHGMRMVGPNCLGLINTDHAVKLNASFGGRMPRPGNIGFISQSGAVCAAVLDYALGANIGFSKFISFGNKADVNEIDLLRFLRDDRDTEVICLYIEDISDGREFIEICREITWETKKPILAIKSGRSAEGAKAAASHTGSLAGSDLAYDAIFSQSGVQRVEGIQELFNYAIAFSQMPAPKGNRLAIVTNSGGPGIMATDTAIRYELNLAQLSDYTVAKLRPQLSPAASLRNPIDIIGDADHTRYLTAVREVIEDPNVDGVIVIMAPAAVNDPLETAKVMPQAIHGVDKPLLCAFMGLTEIVPGVNYLRENGIPNYAFPEEAVRAMASMVKFGNLKTLDKKLRTGKTFEVDRDAASQTIAAKLGDQKRVYLPQAEAGEILRAYGFPLLPSFLIERPDQIEEAAAKVGLPVVMKIMSPDIVHKVDAGGVKLKIGSVAEAKEVFAQIMSNAHNYNPQARLQGVLMEKLAKRGVEVIIGATRDPKFGPICMFGLGGTFVEVFKDVTFRLAPMWEISADIMIRQIKAYEVLKGLRGLPPWDIDAVKDCILRLSQMVTDHPQIAEIDINPLIVLPQGQGCVVADSRILLVPTA